MLSFNFGGKDSYLDYGILTVKRPNIHSPKRRVSYIDIPGRHSNLKFDEGTYEDITIVVECSIKDTKNIIEKIDNIKAWLFGAGESDLIFSFQKDKKYIAQVVNAIDFKQVFKYTSSFPIIFNCKPFKYAVKDNIVVVTKSESIVKNEGTIESEPVIKVYGSGNITLDINEQKIVLNNVDGYVTVDSVLKDAYKDGVLKNNDMIGEFPVFRVGENVVGVSGNVSKLEVNINKIWI